MLELILACFIFFYETVVDRKASRASVCHIRVPELKYQLHDVFGMLSENFFY